MALQEIWKHSVIPVYTPKLCLRGYKNGIIVISLTAFSVLMAKNLCFPSPIPYT